MFKSSDCAPSHFIFSLVEGTAVTSLISFWTSITVRFPYDVSRQIVALCFNAIVAPIDTFPQCLRSFIAHCDTNYTSSCPINATVQSVLLCRTSKPPT